MVFLQKAGLRSSSPTTYGALENKWFCVLWCFVFSVLYTSKVKLFLSSKKWLLTLFNKRCGEIIVKITCYMLWVANM